MLLRFGVTVHSNAEKETPMSVKHFVIAELCGGARDGERQVDDWEQFYGFRLGLLFQVRQAARPIPEQDLAEKACDHARRQLDRAKGTPV